MTGMVCNGFITTKRQILFTLRLKQRQFSGFGLSCVAWTRVGWENLSCAAVCSKIELYFRASMFYPLARPGRSGRENSKRRLVISSLANGKNKNRLSRKHTTLDYATLLCRICRVISMGTNESVSRSLVVWIRAL